MTEEQTLIRLARAGDGPAFEALVTAYETRLYQLAFRYLGHREDALDAVQETFLRVYRFLGGFQEQSSFSTWIYRIAINVCRDLSLQRSRRGEQPLERGEDGEPSPAETSRSCAGRSCRGCALCPGPRRRSCCCGRYRA